jgi:hypothetical protein
MEIFFFTHFSVGKFMHFWIWFDNKFFDTVSWHNASQLVSCANFSIICSKNELKNKNYMRKNWDDFSMKNTKNIEKWEKITTKILTCALNTCNTGEILQKTEWETSMWFCFIHNTFFLSWFDYMCSPESERFSPETCENLCWFHASHSLSRPLFWHFFDAL